MARLLALSLLLAGAAADAGLRGAQRDPSMYDSLFGKSDSSENVDPMDMYIKSASNKAGSVWQKSDDTKDKASSIFDHGAASILDHSSSPSSIFDHPSKDSIFDHPADHVASSIFDHHSGSSIFDHSSDAAPVFKPRSMFGASDDKDTFAADTHAFAAEKVPAYAVEAPAFQAPVAAPQMSGGNGGGAVVDIKLDSELQEAQEVALFQKGTKAATAPDVEAAVASQRMQDVYIHDQFDQQAAADVQKEAEVKANRNLQQ